uniref:Uncharacterized protein n=1 Tax=Anguilla anguilla TaxID=7936 RepID=A0A0E9Y0Y4_ANGAN
MSITIQHSQHNLMILFCVMRILVQVSLGENPGPQNWFVTADKVSNSASVLHRRSLYNVISSEY